REMTVCDAMTATGSRAVRIANEAPKTTVTANDISAYAIPYIEENIRINGLENCAASNRNLHSLLAENVYDYIDIDPFGSPMPFLHSSIIGCRRNGYLAITATDTAPLAGAHRAKCERRYQCRPLRGPMCHEAGLRILIGTIAREAAKFDKGIKPTLSFSSDHYFRTYVQMQDGAGKADDSLKQLIYVAYDPKTLERSYSYEPDREHVHGPYWGGKLFDTDHIEKMDTAGVATERRCTKMLDLWKNEIDDIPLMYEISEISSYLKITTPPFDRFIERMKQYGRTSKTHISPTGFKTELSLDEIFSVYKEVAGEMG
ncbi:MAG: N2,N2-dimethylguanosine tRNA methyltransferase, partial [Candidatus Methanomethylophilaceae archaeon]|nr:N2,N2-dimethylguanosine tRNA methyltransferase [Candidatus Methanomethylophilaceae archaeon]